MIDFLLAESNYKYLFDNNFGYYCNDGWKNIIINCSKELALIDTNKTLKVFEIKEKFGTLRYYVEFKVEPSKKFKELVYSIIHKYEQQSRFVCEFCGNQNAKLNSINGYLSTVCEKCLKNT